ncbi:MAG: hypothetical protein LKJ71_11110, partial [Acetobacter peroxydans]|nr:hypothetical protein [Acetobacter peroxydans]
TRQPLFNIKETGLFHVATPPIKTGEMESQRGPQNQEVFRTLQLVRVLEDWCPPFAGYHLYYTSRREPSAAFSLFVEALRYRPPANGGSET